MRLFRRKRDEMSIEALQAKADAATPAPSTSAAATPAAPGGADFSMTVQDVFSITGRGTVVTGTIAVGTIAVGQVVRLTHGGTARQVRVGGIEMFRAVRDTASVGDNVGLLLDGVAKTDVTAGDVLEV